MADQPQALPPVEPYYQPVRRRYWPVATLVILAVNFIVFGLEISAGGSDDVQVLLNLGAAYGPYMRRGEYWRLVMPIFLHSGWLHILGNSYALYILGPLLERVYGYARYTIIYLLAGVGGAFLSMTVGKTVSVGASGAIFGIAGAMLATGYLHRQAIPRRWGRAFSWGIIPFIIFVLVSGYFSRGTDNWCHVGGLFCGMVLAGAIPPPVREVPYGEIAETPSQALVFLPMAVVAVAMIATAHHYRVIQAMDRLLVQGEQYENAKKYDLEFHSFEQAQSLAPREEQPREEMGAYYLSQKKYDQAIQELDTAIRLTEGGDDHARLELGLAYQLKGDLQKAQEIFESVIGNNPQTPAGQQLLASNEVLLADLYARQKVYADAVRNYQAALRLDPNLAVAHNNLAWLYATCDDPKFRNPKAALAHADLAVRLSDWSQAEFIDTLAESYYVNGKFQQAVDIQAKALALEPNNQEMKDHLQRYRKAADTQVVVRPSYPLTGNS